VDDLLTDAETSNLSSDDEHEPLPHDRKNLNLKLRLINRIGDQGPAEKAPYYSVEGLPEGG
jgi:hypothetical protein